MLQMAALVSRGMALRSSDRHWYFSCSSCFCNPLSKNVWKHSTSQNVATVSVRYSDLRNLAIYYF
jgi:hypothetical protein